MSTKTKTVEEIIVKRYITKDYGMFEEIPENRVAEKMRGHQKHLGVSMEKHGFLQWRAILVVQSPKDPAKLMVLDGQNRLREAKILNIPVVYEIVDQYDNQMLIDLQIAKDWTSKDYMHNYVTIGESESIKYVNWLSELYPKVGAPIIAGLLEGDLSNGSAVGVRCIKKGEVRMTYKDITTDTLLTIKGMIESAIPDKIKKELWRRPFIKAVYALHRNGNFSSQKLLEKMQYHHSKLLIYTRHIDWFNHLEDIYNMSARTPVRFTVRPEKKVAKI